MGRYKDLDALATRRAEVAGEPPVVLLKGIECVLPVEMPFAVIVAAADEDARSFRDATVALLGHEMFVRVVAAGASQWDMRELVLSTQELYDIDPEASSASDTNS